MSRAAVFDAIRADLGRGITPAEVRTIDAFLTSIGVSPAPTKAALGFVGLIDVEVLKAACPERTLAQLEPWVPAIQQACARFQINTIRRIAAFIAQMAHESGLVPGREENLNYSLSRLPQVWTRFAANPAAAPKDRVPNTLARSVAGNPQALANLVYANRMGNGPPESGDGYRFRGVGPGQLTGRNNWTGFAKAMGLSVDEALVYARTLEGGVMSFAWFWEENDINRLADTPGTADETQAVNGGQTGAADRKARFDRTVAVLLQKERT